MWDILLQIGAVALGGVAGYFIGRALVKYWEKAKDWFDRAWRNIQRISRAVGILVRQGNRLFKRFIAELFNGEVEEYYDENDEGVEIEWDELTDEAKKALQEDDYIAVASYS